MKRVKRFFAFLLALLVTVMGLNLSEIPVYAEAEQTATVTPITSIRYDVTVAGISNETSFTWTSTDGGWGTVSKTVELTADGEYSYTLDYSSAVGLINMGYIETIEGSNMTVTVHKITVNDTYELTYGSDPVLQAGTSYNNGLTNIWSGLSAGDIICSNDSAYLALNEEKSMIVFYIKSATGGGSTDVEITTSIEYVQAMGSGWNLGNSFDSVDPNPDAEDKGEESWSNPVVTKELIHAVKEKGYDSIRIPMTVYRRYTVNENAAEGEYKYVIDSDWLKRYKEVVDYAVDEGLYVMINIHHDSWIWLKYWDGNTASEEYRMYTDFWKQLAEYFKDEPAEVCFETINEPTFEDSETIAAQAKLDAVNRAAYEIIRAVPENKERMIVMPTMVTNHEKGAPLYALISSLNDPYIIATVHYYSEWVYSANLGKTGFDEVLWDDDYTARVSADNLMNTIYNQFMKNGIGVIVGEYGLLGYDASENCLQTGEELKYYEYMNTLARQYNVCLMFWDNGSGINRYDYSWKKELVGKMLEASMTERSSYATGLDTIYYSSEAAEDTVIPLTLNGNTFLGIEGLTEGTDYTYDASTAAITLKKEYVNACFANKEGYGTFADLVLKFSAGADWHEYLVKFDTPVAGEAKGTTDGIRIPVSFNGSQVRRITAYQAAGRVGPNSDWWSYLQYDGSFSVDYKEGTISFLKAFFADSSVKNGLMMAKVEFYDGQVINIWMTVDGDTVISSPDLAQDAEDINASSIICLYAGETEIPAQYIYAPEGTGVYGTWVDDTSIVTLSGWPCQMTFDTKAHENFTNGGIVLYYMDKEKYVDVSFGIKDAPVVENVSLKAAETAKVSVTNLSEDAKLSYKSSDEAVAAVSGDGIVTGVKAGTAKIIVTVTQYNRTDSFEATITVTGSADSGNSGNGGNGTDSGNTDSGNSSGTDNSNTGNSNHDSGSSSQTESSAVQWPTSECVYTTPDQRSMRKLANGSLEISGASNVLVSGTQVKATAIVSGSIAEHAAASVAAYLTGVSGYKVFDISMATAAGAEIHQLNGMVSVTLPIPEGMTVGNGMSIMVYRLEADGSLTRCETTIANGKITFQTDHFSTYIFAAYSTAAGAPDTSDSNAGFVAGTLLLLLCGAAVIFLSRKKREM